MGLFNSKVAPMPLTFVVRKLESGGLPEDKDIALQLLEEIDIQLADPKTMEIKIKQLKKLEAIRVIIKVVRKLIEGKFKN